MHTLFNEFSMPETNWLKKKRHSTCRIWYFSLCFLQHLFRQWLQPVLEKSTTPVLLQKRKLQQLQWTPIASAYTDTGICLTVFNAEVFCLKCYLYLTIYIPNGLSKVLTFGERAGVINW